MWICTLFSVRFPHKISWKNKVAYAILILHVLWTMHGIIEYTSYMMEGDSIYNVWSFWWTRYGD